MEGVYRTKGRLRAGPGMREKIFANAQLFLSPALLVHIPHATSPTQYLGLPHL